MIISVEELKKSVQTDVEYEELEAMLLALESAIRQYTNNNFQQVGIRFTADTDVIKTSFTAFLKEGDTLQVSQSLINNGLYTIKSINGQILALNEQIYPEQCVVFTKVVYPAEIKRGVIEIMRWKLKNEAQNYNPEAEKDIQSETISRHSVTYAKDATESDIDLELGVPRKYCAFLKQYERARF